MSDIGDVARAFALGNKCFWEHLFLFSQNTHLGDFPLCVRSGLAGSEARSMLSFVMQFQVVFIDQ